MSDLQPINLDIAPPMPSNPGAPALLEPRGVIKTVALAATPEYLASAQLRFRQLQLYPRKAADGTQNVGAVAIQIRDAAGVFRDVETLQPTDGPLKWSPPEVGQYWNGESFKIRSDNNGDGVLFVYA